ncbi:hypothetical protein Q4E93_04130 [Flavitalea sp. BT771]|uniref:hypothetical protein n=1 Tax=Flavitalea sp. BT771 TaxID=3063329 RepID=UPI0026E31D13|nr:hypothetical protein [Flavitalea sp. BT771]MDO6429756.1 hypothetical protein [Flavitalea sp. BT771]MDV6218116.1 hypothetical protein [Flavitalea sp. BT771]
MREKSLERFTSPGRSISNAENTGSRALMQRRAAPVIQMMIPRGVEKGTTVYMLNRHKYKIKRQSKSDPDYYYVKRKGKNEKKVNKSELYFKKDLPAKKKRDRSDEEADTPKKAKTEDREKEVGGKEVDDEGIFGPVQEFPVESSPAVRPVDTAPKRFFGPIMPPGGNPSMPAFQPGTDFNAKARAAQYPYIPDSHLNRKIIDIVNGLKRGTIKMDKTPHQDQHFTVNRIAPGYHFYLANEDASVWKVIKISDGYGYSWT